jgi:hypothetical protein
LTKKLSVYFEFKVENPRIKVSKKQTLETLICEEALLFAKYLRGERETWTPRKVQVKMNIDTLLRLASSFSFTILT